MDNKNRYFMLKAIELASKAKGKTYPNPLVGALVVKNGSIIGEGYHKRAGTPHAEVIALGKAGKASRESDLYVNLEPCVHYGRTPPCVRAVIKSKIKTIYVSMEDPNPLVNGKGLDILRQEGIKVNLGLCRKEAEELNRIYVRSIKLKRRVEKCLPVS